MKQSGMTLALKKARRLYRLPKFERECRCEYYNGRYLKRYRIPGTVEAKCYAELNGLVAAYVSYHT